MSRGGKAGLDYFPIDIDIFEDEKIELVSARYGLIAELIVIKLLTRIYRCGYFLEWSEDLSYLFSKKFGDGITKELLDNIVAELVMREFFSRSKYDEYHVLTSRGIQRIYLEATKRRKNIEIYKHLLLLDKKDVYILNQNVNILEQNVNIYKQSKVKESKEKVKERKDILSGRPDAVPYEKIIDHLNSKIGSSFKHTTKETRRLIDARWNSGFRLEDFYYVIDIKAHNWLNDEKMRPFLRPCTLFGTKFESYRNEKPKCKQPGLLKFLQKEGVFDEQE